MSCISLRELRWFALNCTSFVKLHEFCSVTLSYVSWLSGQSYLWICNLFRRVAVRVSINEGRPLGNCAAESQASKNLCVFSPSQIWEGFKFWKVLSLCVCVWKQIEHVRLESPPANWVGGSPWQIWGCRGLPSFLTQQAHQSPGLDIADLSECNLQIELNWQVWGGGAKIRIGVDEDKRIKWGSGQLRPW